MMYLQCPIDYLLVFTQHNIIHNTTNIEAKILLLVKSSPSLCIISLIFIRDRHYFYPHCTNRKTKPQRGCCRTQLSLLSGSVCGVNSAGSTLASKYLTTTPHLLSLQTFCYHHNHVSVLLPEFSPCSWNILAPKWSFPFIFPLFLIDCTFVLQFQPTPKMFGLLNFLPVVQALIPCTTPASWSLFLTTFHFHPHVLWFSLETVYPVI